VREASSSTQRFGLNWIEEGVVEGGAPSRSSKCS
jgi:hypothetical protein